MVLRPDSTRGRGHARGWEAVRREGRLRSEKTTAVSASVGRRFPEVCCCLILLGSITANATAAEYERESSVGVGFMDFTYKEFGDDGALLDREDGALPGIAARFARRRGSWALAGGAGVHAGDVAYDGQTNTGVPITTRSGAEITDLYLRTELRSPFSRSWDSAFYFGVGYSRWSRDIRPTTTASGAPVQGLFEVYEWWRFLLGAYVTLAGSTHAGWRVDTQVFRTSNSTVHVDFRGSFDSATLDLGDAWGGRVALQWFRPLSATTSLVVEPYAATWKHGRSATRPLTQNGATVGTLNEPRSETRNVGIAVSLCMRF